MAGETFVVMLRQLTLTIKRVPGAVFILEPIRRLFSRWGTPIVVPDFDDTFKLKVRLDEHMQSKIFWYGYYSRDIVLLMNRILRPGMVVIDVGANIGEITLTAARRVGVGGRVYAFEPMKVLFAQLIENLSVNSVAQVTPIEKGLSHTSGTATIYTAAAQFEDGTWHDGLGTLYPTTSRSIAAGDIVLTTLDEFCSASYIEKIDLLKIDVEGAELAVIKGGLTAITRFQPFLIVEIQADTSVGAGNCSKDVTSLLMSLGYKLFVIGRKAKLRAFQEADLAGFQNVLCVPRGVGVP